MTCQCVWQKSTIELSSFGLPSARGLAVLSHLGYGIRMPIAVFWDCLLNWELVGAADQILAIYLGLLLAGTVMPACGEADPVRADIRRLQAHNTSAI